MENFPLVSIITPTYNHQEFIGACIESVLAQTYPYWEMVIIDDGSTDRTHDIISTFNDRRIQYVRQEHKGIERLSETYNAALSMARGDYIAILEGDDFWPAYKLECQVQDFSDNKVILSFGLTQIVDEDLTVIGRTPYRTLPAEALTNRPVGRASIYMMDPNITTFTWPVSVVIRKSTLLRIGGFQQPLQFPIVDYPTFLRLTLEGEFSFHDEILGFWRRHENSMTRSRFSFILDNVYKCVFVFLAQHASELPIVERERMGIRRKWNEFQAYRFFLLGRWCLAKGDRQTARAAFKEGATYPCGILLRTALWTGVLFSFLHGDMEVLARITGRTVLSDLLKADIPFDEGMLKWTYR